MVYFLVFIFVGLLVCISLVVGLWKDISDLDKKQKESKEALKKHHWMDFQTWDELKKHEDKLDEDYWKNN